MLFPVVKKCTAEENGRDENGRKRRERLEGDPRSAVEVKNRTHGHQHISINEFSGYTVYFRSGPATGVAANYNRCNTFQQNDAMRILSWNQASIVRSNTRQLLKRQNRTVKFSRVFFFFFLILAEDNDREDCDYEERGENLTSVSFCDVIGL